MKTSGTMMGLLLLGAMLLADSAYAQSGTVNVNGVSLPYEITGSGEPLVLIHGWAVHMGFWDTDIETLARHYTVIRYDRRGFGRATGKPDITADAADLKALLDTLGIPRAHIMGHSQGTIVALTFAVRYPEIVDALILFGPGAPPGFGVPAGQDAPPFGEWIAAAREHGIDALKDALTAWAGTRFGDQPDEMMRVAASCWSPRRGPTCSTPIRRSTSWRRLA